MHTLQPKFKITKFDKNKITVQQKYNILGTRQMLSINCGGKSSNLYIGPQALFANMDMSEEE